MESCSLSCAALMSYGKDISLHLENTGQLSGGEHCFGNWGLPIDLDFCDYLNSDAANEEIPDVKSREYLFQIT